MMAGLTMTHVTRGARVQTLRRPSVVHLQVAAIVDAEC
jgi:hypothetical protein